MSDKIVFNSYQCRECDKIVSEGKKAYLTHKEECGREYNIINSGARS